MGGGLVEPGDRRLLWWLPALAVELLAPAIGYATPLLGRSLTSDYDVEGGHFAERCQGFIIIALGESIVVTGATAADAGLGTTVVLALVIAFLETAALWWLYFGEGAALAPAGSRRATMPAVSPATPTRTCTCRSSRGSSRWPWATTC